MTTQTPSWSVSRSSRGTGMSITLVDSLGNAMCIVATSDTESLILDIGDEVKQPPRTNMDIVTATDRCSDLEKTILVDMTREVLVAEE